MTFSRTSIKGFFKDNNVKAWLGASAIALAITFSACSKEDKGPNYEDGKSKIIYNLPGDLETSMGTALAPPDKIKGQFETFLFTFSTAKQHKVGKGDGAKEDWEKLQKSADWDLAFTGPYNSEIYVNNAKQEKNPGFGGTATNTAVVLVRDSYENVTTAPDDKEFDESTLSKIGWSSPADPRGWFEYSMDSHIMKTLPNRTYAIRLQNGKYAKLQIISAYQNYPDDAISDLNWPAPYYTFRYFVQQDGSKNLNTNSI